MPSSVPPQKPHDHKPFWKLLSLSEDVHKLKEIKFSSADIYWLLNHYVPDIWDVIWENKMLSLQFKEFYQNKCFWPLGSVL